jgi:Predicted N-acetylglucosaminyl transferase
MEFELWWLLALPLFFGLGWLAARVDIRQVMTESRSVPASYFKGLNYLLNEQPDKAIEAFIEVVKVDSDTVDLHFALGGLFRKRGEVERAIRMHQNLVAREDLSAERQLQALSELGQDYLKAGLLDRAEEIFDRLQTGDAAVKRGNFCWKYMYRKKTGKKQWLQRVNYPEFAISLIMWKLRISYASLPIMPICMGRLTLPVRI